MGGRYVCDWLEAEVVGGRYGCDWLEEEVVGGRYVCDWLEEEVVGGHYVCVMDFTAFFSTSLAIALQWFHRIDKHWVPIMLMKL